MDSVQTGEVGVTRELATDPSSETATAFPLSCLLDLHLDTTVTQSLVATRSTGDPTSP